MSSSIITDYIGSGLASARPATPNLATGAFGFYWATDTKVLSIWNGSAWETANGATVGGLIGRQVITATGAGTYTPTAGTNSIIIELVGAGGGGSGVANPGTNNVTVGTSGGGGAYLSKRLTANFSGASYSVGAKGTGGSAGANDGSAGGNTTFTDTAGSPTVYTAGGGQGGTGRVSGAPFQVSGQNFGGAATNGDLNIPGGDSEVGIGFTGPFYNASGKGGSSKFSDGARGRRIAANPGNGAGNAAGGYGGGGSSAVANGNTSAAAGGDGSDGIIIIWEYS